MKEKQLVAVVSKSLGLLCILYAFQDAKQIVIYAATVTFYGEHVKDTYFYIGQVTIGLALDFVAAWIFIYKADTISSKLTKTSNENLGVSLGKAEFIELVIVAIGVVAIVNAIPEILRKLVHYLYFNEYGRQDKDLYWKDSNRKVEIVISIVKLAIGLIVVTNGRLIAKRLTKISNRDDSAERK